MAKKSKLVLGHNQIQILLYGLDTARRTFDGMEDEDWCKQSVRDLDKIISSVEKQLGINAGAPFTVSN